VELHPVVPFFIDAKKAAELGGVKADGTPWKGWHVEPATDKVWDEAVCIEGMDATWMRKVNSMGEEVEGKRWTLQDLMHVPVEVEIVGWSECDGKDGDGLVRGAVEVEQVKP